MLRVLFITTLIFNSIDYINLIIIFIKIINTLAQVFFISMHYYFIILN